MKNEFIIIETTCPNLASAEKLTTEILNQNLAACIQLVEIKSRYIWKEKIVSDEEILLRIKSRKSLFSELENTIKNLHDYEVPQIIALNIENAAKSYLDWLESGIKKSK